MLEVARILGERRMFVAFRPYTGPAWLTASGILWSGFVLLLLERHWDTGISMPCWCFRSLLEGARSLPVVKLQAVSRECLSPPGNAHQHTFACQTAVVGELQFIVLSFPLPGFDPSPLPSAQASRSSRLTSPTVGRRYQPARSGLVRIWESSHWIKEADLS